jgi:hypothetical protein
MALRGLQEVWEGACLVRRCFRALRFWATMVGIAVLDRTRQPLTEPDRDGGREAGEWAYDNWESELSVFTAFYTLAQHAQANTALDIAWAFQCAATQRRRLVWLRAAGFDPTIARVGARLRGARAAGGAVGGGIFPPGHTQRRGQGSKVHTHTPTSPPPVVYGTHRHTSHHRHCWERDEPSARPARGPLRQPYGEGPGRQRSGPPSIHSRGQGP